MTFESKLAEGLLLGGRYRIIRKLASGGMSHVYLAEDMRLPGQYWAVKESFGQNECYAAIEAEAGLLISLNHRLLPRVTDFFPPDEQGCSYLVMDYIEGVTLAEYIKTNSGPLAAGEVISYACQLLEVLQYLHNHRPPVIYRDLKPANIILTGAGGLKLIDFGIARSFRAGAGEDTEKLGTAGFAAPEQYGGGQSGPAADLYGLGALLLYMASGGLYSSWGPGMEKVLQPHFPDRLIPVIRRLLRYHPEERYQSAAEVLEVLQPLVESTQRKRTESPPDKPAAVRTTAVISLIGVAAGLGTTHTSLAACSFLAGRGKTAWVGLSPDSTVYERFCSLLDLPPGSKETGAERLPVSWKGIDFWPRPEQGELAALTDGSYAFLVVDLGTGGYAGDLEAFNGSDAALLLASGADWRLEDTLRWLRRSGLSPETGAWRICLPLAGRGSVQMLSTALGGQVNVSALPFQQDPFQRKGKLIHMLDRLLTETGKLHLPVKRSGIFQKRI